MSLTPDDPCWYLSDTRYADCHRDTDIEMRPAVLAALPTIRANLRKQAEYERRLRDEFGIYINYVSPIDFQGGKVAALGDRVYLNRRANETYHKFLVSVLARTFAEEWRARETQRPEPDGTSPCGASISSQRSRPRMPTPRNSPTTATCRPR